MINNEPNKLSEWQKTIIFLERVMSFVMVGIDVFARILIGLALINYLPTIGIAINSGIKIVLLLWIFKPILDVVDLERK